MKQIYDFEPKAVETIISTGMTTTVFRLKITKKENGTWECEEVEYNHKDPLTKDKDYGLMVSILIRSRYSQDRVEAITQGYLADPEGHKGDFDDLQKWRSEAKRIAKALFNKAQ